VQAVLLHQVLLPTELSVTHTDHSSQATSCCCGAPAHAPAAHYQHPPPLLLQVLVPTEVIVTRWASAPGFLGSYSYMATNSSSEDYDIMAQPVGKSLFFSGEATSQEYPGTVHGALLSGERAAAEAAAQLTALGRKPGVAATPVAGGRGNGSSSSSVGIGDAASVGGSAGRGGNGTAPAARSGAGGVQLQGLLLSLLAGAVSSVLLLVS
jgi:hypothetical protein